MSLPQHGFCEKSIMQKFHASLHVPLVITTSLPWLEQARSFQLGIAWAGMVAWNCHLFDCWCANEMTFSTIETLPKVNSKCRSWCMSVVQSVAMLLWSLSSSFYYKRTAFAATTLLLPHLYTWLLIFGYHTVSQHVDWVVTHQEFCCRQLKFQHHQASTL